MSEEATSHSRETRTSGAHFRQPALSSTHITHALAHTSSETPPRHQAVNSNTTCVLACSVYELFVQQAQQHTALSNQRQPDIPSTSSRDSSLAPALPGSRKYSNQIKVLPPAKSSGCSKTVIFPFPNGDHAALLYSPTVTRTPSVLQLFALRRIATT